MELREVYEKWVSTPKLHFSGYEDQAEMLDDLWSAIRAAVEERCVWTRERFPSSVVIWHPACSARSVFQSTMETLRPSHCPYCGRELVCKEVGSA